MARYAGRLEGFPDWQELSGTGMDLMEAFHAQDDALNELREKSDALPEGEIVGHLMSFGVADGSANYVVVKESPLTLAWAPIPDNYQIPAAHLRGITKRDVLEDQASQRRFADLFSRR